MCSPIPTAKQNELVSELNCDNLYIALSYNKLDASKLLDFVKSPDCGAVAYFGGTTRDSMDGKHVTKLSYEAYNPMALKTLTKVAHYAQTKWNGEQDPQSFIRKVAVVHRLGDVPVMEDSVMIAVSAAHRKEAWEAAEWILEQIKSSAEIWKNEKYSDGAAVWRSNEEDAKHKVQTAV